MKTVRYYLRIVLSVASFTGALFFASAADGTQEAPLFRVEVDMAALSQSTGVGGTLGQNLGHLTAFANGQMCGSVDVATETGNNPVILLGLQGQPEPCSTEGAVVVILDGMTRQLSEQFTVIADGRTVLKNLAPGPPGSGYFIITMSAASLNVSVSQAATGASTLREALKSITVFADGQACLTADLSLTAGDVVLLLGPGQPAVCSANSATLTFSDGNGRRLVEGGALRPGEAMVLSNFAPDPAAVVTPSSTPTVGTDPGPSVISPPDTGGAGLADRGDLR